MGTFTLTDDIIYEDGHEVASVNADASSDTGARLVGMLNLLGKLEEQLAKIRDLADIDAL